MEQETISNLRVTSRTAEFVTALELLEKTQDHFLQALCTLYGEEQGNKFFNEKLTAFDSAKDCISEFLTLSIVSSLGDGTLKETI